MQKLANTTADVSQCVIQMSIGRFPKLKWRPKTHQIKCKQCNNDRNPGSDHGLNFQLWKRFISTQFHISACQWYNVASFTWLMWLMCNLHSYILGKVSQPLSPPGQHILQHSSVYIACSNFCPLHFMHVRKCLEAGTFTSDSSGENTVCEAS